MIELLPGLSPAKLLSRVERMFDLSGAKIRSIEQSWSPAAGSPVCTVNGRYASRGWTEWTQGFQFGSAILQFDATGDREFLKIGREGTVSLMAPHVSHTGVHDHGFNNVSTYGNLLRLMNERRIPDDPWERRFYEMALKISGAVQASRWSRTSDGGGYIYSFNGPHSLFVDTIRSVRALVVSHQLGHLLMAENDRKISLLDRARDHIRATAKYSVYYGEGRDAYDISGRTAHEAVFNTNDGNFRCPNSQQGYSPFSTWTRGLAWAICGFAEQLEFFADTDPELKATMEKAARATCDFYMENTREDGIPSWDTASSDPIDSSAAAIAAQGFLRLGRHLGVERYTEAGLTIAHNLFAEPYLSTDPNHQGLILHSVYHRPNGWNWEPGESSMWGDYHARELGVYLQRLASSGPYLTYFL